ncbi:DNA polymerase I [Patescibacteria group bacterium]
MVTKKKKTLALIDTHALLHRGFHAIPPTLRTSDGQVINAVFGFTSILLNVLNNIKPDYIVAASDPRGPTFRHDQYKEYKAQRVKAPDELYQQIPLVKKVIETLNIPIIEVPKFEADDVIATLATQAGEDTDLETMVVTGDLDVLQLVDKQTKIFTMRKGIKDIVIYDEAAVFDRYGLRPDQMIDYKALRGDASDNIPGVPGIGEKTAVKLIQEFKTLENLYREIEKEQKKAGDDFKGFERGDVKIKGKLLENLLENKDAAFESQDLVTLKKDVKIKLDLKASVIHDYDRDKVVDLFQKFQFKSLIDRLPKSSNGQSKMFASAAEEKTELPKRLPQGHELITKDVQLQSLVNKIAEKKKIALSVKITDERIMQADLVGLSIALGPEEAYYLPFAHAHDTETQAKQKLTYKDQLNINETLALLKNTLKDNKVEINGHDLKSIILILKRYGIDLEEIHFDTELAAYVLDPGRRGYSLDGLIFNHTQHELRDPESFLGTGKTKKSFSELEPATAALWACEEITWTYKLVMALEKKIEAADADTQKVYREIELPLVPVLAQMQFLGIKLDDKNLKKISITNKKRIQELEVAIHKSAGREFLISSPSQLSEVLFEDLSLPREDIKRGKNYYSTAATELEKLHGKHPIIEQIEEYRELAKLQNTYIEALPKLINPETKRIHTSFNQTVTATGRLSSSDPNLQNIPIRSEAGREIREAFVAPKGKKFLALDYNQIELRILAHISQDKRMLAAFNEGRDIHTSTAAIVLDKPYEDVTENERRIAKIVNFSIIYGVSPYGLAQRTDMDRDEAKIFIDRYYEFNPQVKKILDALVGAAKKLGYSETIDGRKRYLPDLQSSQYQVRTAAERAALNHPFQGTAADIIKKAMIQIWEKVPESRDRLLLQVHDELVFEVPEDGWQDFAKQIKEIMENVVKLTVPTTVDIEIGTNWNKLEKTEI